MNRPRLRPHPIPNRSGSYADVLGERLNGHAPLLHRLPEKFSAALIPKTAQLIHHEEVKHRGVSELFHFWGTPFRSKN
jgi:hypothetical protein